MKCLIAFACAAPLVAVCALRLGIPGASDTVLTGDYVEARSASVYAGPCHYNGEYTTQGREAVFAMSIDSGRHGGVDLAGARAVVAVAADANLAEGSAAKSSVVYVPRDLCDAKCEALVAALRARCGPSIGEVREVKRADIAFEARDGEFEVRVPDALVLRGKAMPNRECCTMPENVWYAPMVSLDRRMVGNCDDFELRESALGTEFTRHDENNAFVGRMRLEPPRRCCPFSPAPPPAAPNGPPSG